MSSALLLARRSTLRIAPQIRRSAAIRASSSTPAPPPGYVPGGPIYLGEVNDSLPFPTPSKSHGSHHWAFERLLAATLVPLTASAFVASGSAYPVLDGILGVSLIAHSHMGFGQVLEDYVHPRKFSFLGPFSKWALRLTTTGVLIGVYQFNTNDIGLTELVKTVWKA